MAHGPLAGWLAEDPVTPVRPPFPSQDPLGLDPWTSTLTSTTCSGRRASDAVSATCLSPQMSPLPMPGSPAASWALYRSRLKAAFAGADYRVYAAFWLFGMSRPWTLFESAQEEQ